MCLTIEQSLIKIINGLSIETKCKLICSYYCNAILKLGNRRVVDPVTNLKRYTIGFRIVYGIIRIQHSVAVNHFD